MELRNMHCAMHFQLCHAGQDVFADGSPEQQKEARKIAIAVILHTDNIHHFDMVKDFCMRCCIDAYDIL